MVNGAAHAEAGAIADVGVNHRGRDILVAEEFLDGTNIITVLQQMGSKTVPKGMAACRFFDTAGSNGILDGVLKVSLRHVMAASFAAARVDCDFLGREDILPGPFARGFRIFPVQGTGKINSAAAAGEILTMQFFDAGEMRLERAAESRRQHGHAFPHSFPFADGDLPVAEIDIFYAQPQAFE